MTKAITVVKYILYEYSRKVFASWQIYMVLNIIANTNRESISFIFLLDARVGFWQMPTIARVFCTTCNIFIFLPLWFMMPVTNSQNECTFQVALQEIEQAQNKISQPLLIFLFRFLWKMAAKSNEKFNLDKRVIAKWFVERFKVHWTFIQSLPYGICTAQHFRAERRLAVHTFTATYPDFFCLSNDGKSLLENI